MRALALLIIVALIWAVGLLAFGARVERSTPAEEPPVSDAVVALTGASTLRLEAAVKLLENGKGRRLLVSGVNKLATRKDIKSVTKAQKPIYDCCVDLDYTAADTAGNAEQIADWARSKGYRSLIVVTADYHMPRAMLEIRAALPGVKLTAYPVATETLDASRWWADGVQARRMTIEYCKYLAILARESVRSLFHPKDKPAQPAKPAKGTAP